MRYVNRPIGDNEMHILRPRLYSVRSRVCTMHASTQMDYIGHIHARFNNFTRAKFISVVGIKICISLINDVNNGLGSIYPGDDQVCVCVCAGEWSNDCGELLAWWLVVRLLWLLQTCLTHKFHGTHAGNVFSLRTIERLIEGKSKT